MSQVQVMTLRGKAKQVFKYMKLVSRYKGNVTVKELLKAKAKS
jgi:hypothetical protein